MVASNEDNEPDAIEHATGARTAGAENGALSGAIPPTEIERETSTTAEAGADDEKRRPRRRVLQVLAKWGPWRRFAWYLKTQREERQGVWRERDSEENERGRLPPTESVQLPAIWVAELYTPSSVEGLFRGISNLGWEHGRSRDDSLLKWMSEVRQGRRAGWISLGLVSPPSRVHFMSERTAVLPEGVDAALPILISMTPSITALVTAFILDDQAAASVDKPLRAEYATRSTRSPLFRRRDLLFHILFGAPVRLARHIYDPDLQRREVVRTCLAELERACTHWVRQNLPGVFASGIRSGAFPTALILVTEVAAPVTEEARSIRAFDGLAINRDYDTWGSEEWPGARLVLPRSWDEEGLRLTFACRRRDAFPERPGYPDPESNWTIAQRADDLIHGLLSRWALSGILDGYHELLSELRDRLAGTQTHRPVQDLKALRLLVRTKLFDIVASSHDIEEFASEQWRYRHDVLEMKYARSSEPEQTNLLDTLTREQHRRCEQVRRDAELLRTILSVTVGASQAIASVRIQLLAIVLSILSTGIAVAAFIVSTRRP